MNRPQISSVLNDLSRKMVFLTGPRQVGKTSLARQVAEHFPGAVYLNYDHFEDRAIIRAMAWLPSTPLVVLDELHKMEGWKNYLKGLYDTKPASLRILVTGSARLEIFRQMGIPLTHVNPAGMFRPWKWRGRFPVLITRGHSRKWMTGSERRPSVVTTSGVCAGRLVLYASGVESPGSLG